MIKEFLWSECTPRIRTKTLQLPKEHGGLKLTELTNKQRSLYTLWIFRSFGDVFLSIDCRCRAFFGNVT